LYNLRAFISRMHLGSGYRKFARQQSSTPLASRPPTTHMGAPYFNLTQIRVQEDNTSSSLVYEEITGNDMQGQAGQGIRKGMGGDDRET
jgi:hypothetical protein